MKKTYHLSTLFLAISSAFLCAQTSFNFDFGGKGMAGSKRVSPTDIYSTQTGYGFEPGATVTEGNQAITSAAPFYFSVKLPDGNYKVRVLFGDKTGESTTTVKSELRRLMVEKVHAAPGKSEDRSFINNVRTPKFSGENRVSLKQREMTTELWNWDEKLTLEFNGDHPTISALKIEKVDVPTVYVLGDSTVCDQPAEPWNSWGQMLPRFFKPEVAVSNHAESGETLGGSLHAKRFDKVFSQMKKGDYLFVQFGHNDQKEKGEDRIETYKTNLKMVISRTRELGGTPVLVTSMERKGGVDHDTLVGYPDAVIAVAKEQNCALIDLHAMSRVFYHALGADLAKAFQDGTHHNNYGSYELAKCIIEGIKQAKLPLAESIVDDFGDFSPSKPDAVATFLMPVSPVKSADKPLGN